MTEEYRKKAEEEVRRDIGGFLFRTEYTAHNVVTYSWFGQNGFSENVSPDSPILDLWEALIRDRAFRLSVKEAEKEMDEETNRLREMNCLDPDDDTQDVVSGISWCLSILRKHTGESSAD